MPVLPPYMECSTLPLGDVVFASELMRARAVGPSFQLWDLSSKAASFWRGTGPCRRHGSGQCTLPKNMEPPHPRTHRDKGTSSTNNTPQGSDPGQRWGKHGPKTMTNPHAAVGDPPSQPHRSVRNLWRPSAAVSLAHDTPQCQGHRSMSRCAAESRVGLELQLSG